MTIKTLAKDWHFISDMILGQYKQMEYQGYRKKQAIKLFKEQFKKDLEMQQTIIKEKSQGY